MQSGSHHIIGIEDNFWLLSVGMQRVSNWTNLECGEQSPVSTRRRGTASLPSFCLCIFSLDILPLFYCVCILSAYFLTTQRYFLSLLLLHRVSHWWERRIALLLPHMLDELTLLELQLHFCIFQVATVNKRPCESFFSVIFIFPNIYILYYHIPDLLIPVLSR